MLWEEGFVTTAFDIPIQEVVVHGEPSAAVSYSADTDRHTWSKTINLEKCDRSGLSSLLSNINFTRKLAVPVNSQITKAERPFEKKACLNLPTNIRLNECSLIISYQLSPVGSAFDLISRLGCGGLPEAAVAAIISRAVVSLDQLHSFGVLHRNLCGKHLLLSTEQQSVLLCGLGSVCQFPPRGFAVGRNDLPPIYFAWRGWNVQADVYSHPCAWYAPEVMVQDFTGYSWPADVYSLGLTLAELYTGQPPYMQHKPSEILIEKLCGHIPLELKQDVPRTRVPSKPMMEFYNACTQYNANVRPTTKSLLKMPWVQWGLGLPLDFTQLEYYASKHPPES